MRGLPRKQAKAITALLNHRTVGEAAEAVGVGQSTLFRWLQDTDFQSAYRDAKRRVVDQAIANVQRASGEAVEALKSIMIDDDMPASSRVTAARTVLDMAIRALELEQLEARVKTLEEHILK